MQGWEHIGSESPAGGNMSRVPYWVNDALSQMYAKDADVFRRACYEDRLIMLRGKTYQYAIGCGGQAGQYRSYYRRKRSTGKRNRATALVIREGKVLLVRDKGRRRLSLPGGAIPATKSGLDAMKRHLLRETGLKVRNADLMFTHESRVNRHHVFRIDAVGKVRLPSGDVAEYAWWDGNVETPVRNSVREILSGARIVFTRQ